MKKYIITILGVSWELTGLIFLNLKTALNNYAFIMFISLIITIKSNPNWKLEGIYADDGKSATNTKKRNDFNTMIEDCMAGKVDLVITKSVSRFARNTVDSLQNIRKLKEKNLRYFCERRCQYTGWHRRAFD